MNIKVSVVQNTTSDETLNSEDSMVSKFLHENDGETTSNENVQTTLTPLVDGTKALSQGKPSSYIWVVQMEVIMTKYSIKSIILKAFINCD